MRNASPIPSNEMATPVRMAARRAASAPGFRQSATAATKVAIQRVVMANAMIAHTAVAVGVDTLKWLVIPSPAAATMSTSSTARALAMTVPAHHAGRRQRSKWPMIHAQVTA